MEDVSAWWAVLAIGGLGFITVITRGFFMIPEREMPMPEWVRRGLRYAPLAALTAVIAPEVLMSQGALIESLRDARLPAVAAAVLAYYRWHSILGMIAAGMALYLPLRLILGW